MAMPREMFPVAAMLVSMYHVLPQLVILLVACLAYGWTPDPGTILAVLLAVAIIAILGTALALLFSVANVFFRDFGSVVSILSHFVRFGVPMLYPFSMVTERFGHFAQYYLLDPLADAVLLMQRGFWLGTTTPCAPGQVPSKTNQCTDPATAMPAHLWMDGLLCLVAALVGLLVAQLVFTKLENKIPERL
jgi:ABC-2 type transport system permease protein